jgi:hypothetical protein
MLILIVAINLSFLVISDISEFLKRKRIAKNEKKFVEAVE